MPSLQRIEKTKTKRGKRILETKEPLTIENTKQILFLHGSSTGEVSRRCLKDLYALKRCSSVHLNRKNDIKPFEDATPLERLSKKHDASLFAFINHNKKRPNNLVLGRFYDYSLLDMIEFGISNYTSISDIPGPKVASGTKPCMSFHGPDFAGSDLMMRIKNLLIDFFRGYEATNVRLQGFEHHMQFTAIDGKIFVRSYKILLKKSGTRLPRIELEEIGPSFTLEYRRTKLASEDLYKIAIRKPRKLKPKKKKNISRDAFGTKLGRIHMTKQDLGNLQTRKVNALKKTIGKAKTAVGKAKTAAPMETQ